MSVFSKLSVIGAIASYNVEALGLQINSNDILWGDIRPYVKVLLAQKELDDIALLLNEAEKEKLLKRMGDLLKRMGEQDLQKLKVNLTTYENSRDKDRSTTLLKAFVKREKWVEEMEKLKYKLCFLILGVVASIAALFIYKEEPSLGPEIEGKQVVPWLLFALAVLLFSVVGCCYKKGMRCLYKTKSCQFD